MPCAPDDSKSAGFTCHAKLRHQRGSAGLIVGSETRVTGECRNPYMFSDVNAWFPFSLGFPLDWAGRYGGCSLLCPAEASVASRSRTEQRATTANPAPPPSQPRFGFGSAIIILLSSPICLSCAGKNMRPALLRKGCLAARASSCNPRTAFSQSEAQPEPRTPCAPNSNRCQSGGYHRQLVFVRLS